MSDGASAERLLLAGDGHGAIAALDGLAQRFARIDLVTSDDDLAARAPEAGRYATVAEAPHRIVVMAGHRDILPREVLAARHVLNVHYSLLPKYRGLHSVVWAMLNDEPEIGLSVHLADAGIDSGAILHQHAVTLRETMTAWDMMEALDAHVADRLGDVVAGWLAGRATPRPQDDAQATWVPRRDMDDCLVDFSETHRQLSLLFRALVAPYPLPQMRLRAGRFEITDHRLIPRDYRTHLGRVVNLDAEGAWIKTREGILLVRRLRALGGAARPAAEVLRLGERLA